MTTAVIALAAAAAALLIVGAIGIAGARSRRRSEALIGHALDDVGARMNLLADELSDAITRTQDESRRLRLLGALGNVVDLDEVLARTAEAAAELPGVDAALVRVVEPDGTPVVASIGLPPEAAAQHVLTGPPDAATVRSTRLAYAYHADDERPESLRTGFVVQVEAERGLVGHIGVFSRESGWQSEGAVAVDLEAIAEQAGPAIHNALRFREFQQAADTDALTGLLNRRAFHATIDREVSRAHRYDRNLALLLLDLDDFKAVNTELGLLVGDAVLADVADRLSSVARGSDIVCRWGGDEFALILPESSRVDAEGLFARIQASLQRRPPEQVDVLTLSGGIAELRSDDDPISFFERAEEALRRAKGDGKGRAG